MPGTTGPRHGFVWGYSPGETTWGVGAFNPNFAKLEALLHLSVTSITSTPPLTPANGMVYIVGGSPTGVWAGQANAVAASTEERFDPSGSGFSQGNSHRFRGSSIEIVILRPFRPAPKTSLYSIFDHQQTA